MSSETTLAAEQFHLQEWAIQIRDCRNRPDGMSVVEWCARNGLTKANYYYRLRCVRKACLEKLPPDTAVQQIVPVEPRLLKTEEVRSLTPQQFRWLMEGLTITPKKSVRAVEPPEYIG